MRYLFLLLYVLIHLANLRAQTRTGRDYAVFFYCTDFKPGLAPLPETKTEATALKTELETNYSFTCELVANPTKQQIRDKIRAYNARLTPNDQVLFFFSMHGHYTEDGERGYLIPKDGEAGDDYGDTWLSYDDLRTDLAPCKAKHVLLALDACYSGTFGTRNRTIPPAPVFAQEDDCQTKMNKVMQYTGRQYCSSGNKTAKTPAKSLFAARFLEALRKGGENGMLRFDTDLEYYLKKADNPRPETGSFSKHDPGADFIFLRTNACAPEVDSDADGVPDNRDKCPQTWGSNPEGCPALIKEDNTAADLDAWKTAKNQGTELAYREYLRRYPNGEFKELANNALRKLETQALQRRDDTAWDIAQEKNTQEGYQKYLNDYPAGRHVTEARAAKAALEEPAIPSDGLVFIKGGTYTMGCTSEQKDCDADEKPSHTVTVSDFYLGQFEVTQKLWQEVMGNNPSGFKNCDDCPVEQVSWDDVQDFLKKLNAKNPGKNYRLPTEAEWEYAAREGGKAVLFGNGKNVIDPAEINFNATESYKKDYSVVGEYRRKTVPVGSLRSPNALGLHDMSGNVWEWCSDWNGSYVAGNQKDPTGPATGSYRVIRGGSWGNYPQDCRVAIRSNYTPGNRNYVIGFRLARTK